VEYQHHSLLLHIIYSLCILSNGSLLRTISVLDGVVTEMILRMIGRKLK